MSNAFSYLSVLLSIIVGLGMSHVLGALVRIIRYRARIQLYWPTLVWAANLFLLFMLVWWSGFYLNRHHNWTFAGYACTLAIPALLYVAGGLLLPVSETRDDDDMRTLYYAHRVWLYSLVTAAVALSFVQTYLLDGHVMLSLDSGLKIVLTLFCFAMIFVKSESAQKIAALVNLAWLFAFITILFNQLT